MPWYVITKENGSMEGRSPTLASEKAALIFARELIAAGVAVQRVEGDGDGVTGERVADRLAELEGER